MFRNKINPELMASHSLYLTKVLIVFYKWILSVVFAKISCYIQSIEILQEVQNVLNKDLLNFKESKIANVWKTNLVIVKYNTAAVMYLMNQQDEWMKTLK